MARRLLRPAGRQYLPPFNEGIAAPRLCGAIDQLLGQGTWRVPAGWGGFLISFPVGTHETWEITPQGWHWDDTLPNHFDSPRKSVFVFTLFSEVKPRGGGTLVVSGSHRLIERFYRRLPSDAQQYKQKTLKPRFVRSYRWFQELCGDAPERTYRIARFMEQESQEPASGTLLRPITPTCPDSCASKELVSVGITAGDTVMTNVLMLLQIDLNPTFVLWDRLQTCRRIVLIETTVCNSDTRRGFGAERSNIRPEG